MKKIITFSCLVFSGSLMAEMAQFNTGTNTLNIPVVQVNNHNYSNVVLSCDTQDGFVCYLTAATDSSCVAGVFDGNLSYNSNNIYSVHTRSSNGIEYGGMQLRGSIGNEFTASWVKSEKNINPYLNGRDLNKFKDNQAYGVIGAVHSNAYPGFLEGDLITVIGGPTGFYIKQVDGNATASFNNGNDIATNNTCNSTSDLYTGNLHYNSNNKYNVNIFTDEDGSIQLNSSIGNEFTAGWNGEEKFIGSYSLATLGSVHGNAYENFEEGDEAFVTDIGNGIAITAIDSETGLAKATAVFIKQ